MALELVWTSSHEMPSLSQKFVVSILPANTPMDAVSVAGWATILSAGHRDEIAAGPGHSRPSTR